MTTHGPEVPPDPSSDSDTNELRVVWHQDPPAPKRAIPKQALLIAAAAVIVALAITAGVVLTRDPSAGSPESNGRTTSPPVPTPTAPTSPPTSPTSAAASGPPDFSAAVSTASAAVVRVLASTCQGTGVGTGFWIDDRTVVTSYQSVAKSVSVAVVDSIGTPTVATISGTDRATGVALLDVEGGSPGGSLTIGDAPLATGDWVAPVGIPSRRSDAVGTLAKVSSTGEALVHRGARVSDLAVVPGGVDIGLGGAPVVDSAGTVVGAVFALPDRQQRLVTPAHRLSAGIAAARTSGAPKAGSCPLPTGPHSQTAVVGDAPAAMMAGLKAYFGGINSADYQRAFGAMGPFHHEPGKVAPDWTSTYDFNIRVRSSRLTPNGARAWIVFDSIQRSDKGPKERHSCARWSMNYSFVYDGDRLEVDRTSPHGGVKDSWTAC